MFVKEPFDVGIQQAQEALQQKRPSEEIHLRMMALLGDSCSSSRATLGGWITVLALRAAGDPTDTATAARLSEPLVLPAGHRGLPAELRNRLRELRGARQANSN